MIVMLGLVQPYRRILDIQMMRNIDKAISLVCKVTCPYATVDTEDWALGDPEGNTMGQVRHIRDETKAGVLRLLAEFG